MLAGFGINIKGIVEKDKGNLRKTVVVPYLWSLL
jgi:hypothetical protein